MEEHSHSHTRKFLQKVGDVFDDFMGGDTNTGPSTTMDKGYTTSNTEGHSHTSKLIQKVGDVFGDYMGGESAGNSSNTMRLAKGLLQNLNTRTDTEGGLTQQIIGAAEQLFSGHSNESQGDLMSKAEHIVKSLLSNQANASMGPMESDDGTFAKLSKKAKRMARGILAKKVIEDILSGGQGAGAITAGGKRDMVKKLLVGVLTNEVAGGERSAQDLEGESGHLGGLMSKAKLLAKGMLAKKSAEGLFKSESNSHGGYTDMIKIFAEEVLVGKAVGNVLDTAAAKYGIDSNLVAEAKELYTNFDKTKAKGLVKEIASSYMDKGHHHSTSEAYH